MARGRALGPGRLWRRGDAWVLDWRGADGKRVHRVLSHDRRTAERIRSELVHQRDLELAGLGAQAGQERRLAEIVEAYLADLQPRVTPRHHGMVAARLAALLDRLGPIRVRDLRPMDVTRVRSELTAKGAAARTANLTVDSLGACLRWGVRNELVGKNPIANVARLPERGHERRRRRALNDLEIDRLLDAAEDDDRRGAARAACDERVRVPQRILLQALLETGARWNELRSATWGDLDFGQRLLVLRAENTKSRRQRSIPLRATLADELRALQVLHQRVLGRLPTAAEHVFLSPEGRPWGRPTTNIGRLLHRWLRRAGIPRVDVEGRTVDLHALRHTAASQLVQRGVNIVHVQRLLGHSDVRLTASVYSHVETEDLRVALAAQGRRAESAQLKPEHDPPARWQASSQLWERR